MEPRLQEKMEKMKKAIPKSAFVLAGTLATAVVGVTVRGDLLLVGVQLYKIFNHQSSEGEREPATHTESMNETTKLDVSSIDWRQSMKLRYIEILLPFSLFATFVSYFAMGGFMQYYYYYKRKDQAKEWKCQPDRWLTPANERHEILLGTFNMFLGGTISGFIATYIYNGGECRLYFGMFEKGVPYLIASTILLFLIQDGMAYYVHRISHTPFLYKLYHKMHHRYHCPTAFSAVAMHPLEFLMYQVVLASPILYMPLYSGSFILTLVYNYYYGMMDHSGVKMDALWPWQPPTLFHDNHHKLFHVNFGFNTFIWDWLHDTLRKDSRTYGEDVFGGKGITAGKQRAKTN